ncbi:pigment epithelium-derived factor [Rana temporaria]|uniref:pigment epithelium-derived factor n=1 Tax=Rana temporaria TaxID=8407 RepID=UPI001AADBA1B|nr:pigment epithelium-derived factor [Rana temporaria]XP_040194309.1 pigment epithelium-derived factor [Rana temporaria]
MKNYLVFLLAATIFSFTSSQDAAEENPTVVVEEEEDPFYKTPVNRLASSASNFGYDLYRMHASKNPSINIFMSPLTLATALSSVSLGAGERTESLIHRTLYYDLLNDPEIHATYKELLASLSSKDKVKSTHRVILERRLRLKVDFVNQMEKFYGQKPRVLSGNSRLDLSEANNFVQQRTDGKVLKCFKEIPSGVSVLLLGAAYFKGQWVHKFNPRETVLREFYTDEQTSISVPMMTANNVPVRYGLDSDFSCRIMQLPLIGGISIMFFLPLTVTQNLTLIEEGLTSEFVHDIDRALQSVTIKLSLPKLKLDYEAELGSALQDMKLQPLFSAPDFSKISSKSVKLTQAVHKVAMELSEDGKEEVPKVDPKQINHFPLEFHLDHPFIFVLRADDNGALLFIGKVMNPKGLSR